MSQLNLQPNLSRPDDIYELLILLHEGLTEAESMRINSRLILLLANHVGDEQVIREAITAARRQVLTE